MPEGKCGKLRLDMDLRRSQPSRMHLRPIALVAVLAPTAAHAQAPQASGLWDIPATTLAQPPALETGVIGTFWNPVAVVDSGRLRVAAQAIQTPDVVGLGGVLVGFSHPLNRRLGIGIIFGRVEVVDLVRTSTSPAALPGDIPVYEQSAGVAVGAQTGPATFGVLFRGHDARFDVFREGGFSADAGARVTLANRVTIAAASRFVPLKGDGGTPTRYYGGIEVRALDAPVWNATGSVFVRYGLLTRHEGGWEHTIGGGLELASRLELNAAYIREAGFAAADWRLVLSLGVRAGRYEVVAARGSGLRGIGANYRAGLEVDFGT